MILGRQQIIRIRRQYHLKIQKIKTLGSKILKVKFKQLNTYCFRKPFKEWACKLTMEFSSIKFLKVLKIDYSEHKNDQMSQGTKIKSI